MSDKPDALRFALFTLSEKVQAFLARHGSSCWWRNERVVDHTFCHTLRFGGP